MKPKSLSEWRRTTKRQPLVRGKGLLREPVYCHVGKVICEMRERLQISQTIVAEALGLTRAQISNVEAGRSRIMLHQLPIIARVLRIPIADLLPPEFLK